MCRKQWESDGHTQMHQIDVLKIFNHTGEFTHSLLFEISLRQIKRGIFTL